MFFDGMRGICFYLFGVFWTNKHVRWHERCNWYVGRWSDIFTAASCHQDMNLSWICVSSYPLYSCQHCPSPLWDLISYSVPSRSRQLSLNSKRFQCHHSHARNWSAQEQLATLPSCVRPHHLFFFFQPHYWLFDELITSETHLISRCHLRQHVVSGCRWLVLNLCESLEMVSFFIALRKKLSPDFKETCTDF